MRLSDSTVCKIKDFINKRVEDYHSDHSNLIVGAVVGVIYGRRDVMFAISQVLECENDFQEDLSEYFTLYVYTSEACGVWGAGNSYLDSSLNLKIRHAIKHRDRRVMDVTHFSNLLYKSINIFREE